MDVIGVRLFKHGRQCMFPKCKGKVTDRQTDRQSKNGSNIS